MDVVTEEDQDVFYRKPDLPVVVERIQRSVVLTYLFKECYLEKEIYKYRITKTKRSLGIK